MKDREKDVLLATIKEYINTAKPVSSRHLKVCGFKFSGATIRNTLATLEKEGYLMHPHTSAGRIPTEQGYRYFVNNVSRNLILGLEQRRYIMDFFSTKTYQQALLKQTSKFMAEVTSYLGIVIGNYSKKITVKHIDLIGLSNGQLLLVTISENGEIFKEKLVVKKYDFDVQELENILNRELSGLALDELKEKSKHLSALGLFGSLFESVTSKLIELLEKEQTGLYYDGITNLLDFPEFSTINIFSEVLEFFEERQPVLKELGAKVRQGDVYVAIGEESAALSLRGASLVLAPYCNHEQVVGAVGLLGPMRMDYKKAIATTECVAGNLSHTLQKMA